MKRELQKLSAIALSLEKEGNIVAGRIITEAMQKNSIMARYHR